MKIEPDTRPPERIKVFESGRLKTADAKVERYSIDHKVPIIKTHCKKLTRTNPRDFPITRHPQRAAPQQQDYQDDPKILHGSIVRGGSDD